MTRATLLAVLALAGVTLAAQDYYKAGGGTSVSASEFTTTTTGNIDDLDFANASLIRMNNATLATIRGLKAGTAGQLVKVVSVGAGQVEFAHQNTSDATAASRLINYATLANTPLAAGVGTATYVYDGTAARWRLASHQQGAPITVAFSAGNFTSPTGTWVVEAGDVPDFAYSLVNRDVTVTFSFIATTVTGTPALLKLTLPGGFVSTKLAYTGGLLAADNATWASTGAVEVPVGTTFVQIYRAYPSPAWSASTNLTYIYGRFTFPVG
jgi:hypothetical protein